MESFIDESGKVKRPKNLRIKSLMDSSYVKVLVLQFFAHILLAASIIKRDF